MKSRLKSVAAAALVLTGVARAEAACGTCEDWSNGGTTTPTGNTTATGTGIGTGTGTGIGTGGNATGGNATGGNATGGNSSAQGGKGGNATALGGAGGIGLGGSSASNSNSTSAAVSNAQGGAGGLGGAGGQGGAGGKGGAGGTGYGGTGGTGYGGTATANGGNNSQRTDVSNTSANTLNNANTSSASTGAISNKLSTGASTSSTGAITNKLSTGASTSSTGPVSVDTGGATATTGNNVNNNVSTYKAASNSVNLPGYALNQCSYVVSVGGSTVGANGALSFAWPAKDCTMGITALNQYIAARNSGDNVTAGAALGLLGEIDDRFASSLKNSVNNYFNGCARLMREVSPAFGAVPGLDCGRRENIAVYVQPVQTHGHRTAHHGHVSHPVKHTANYNHKQQHCVSASVPVCGRQ